MQTIVKICGMTDAASIQTAIDHKVDYLGFVFYPKSPRNLSPKQATILTKNIPSHIGKVAVIVDETDQFIEYIKKDFDYFQLHGNEDLKRIIEIKKVRKISKNFEIIVPGIRISNKVQDQKRVMTPKKALQQGASYLVIGRDITQGNIKKNIIKIVNSLN